MKPTLTAPGVKRLKLKYDELLSNFAFNSNLRRYSKGIPITMTIMYAAVVGRCRLTG